MTPVSRVGGRLGDCRRREPGHVVTNTSASGRRGYPFAAAIGSAHLRARRFHGTLPLFVVFFPLVARMCFCCASELSVTQQTRTLRKEQAPQSLSLLPHAPSLAYSLCTCLPHMVSLPPSDGSAERGTMDPSRTARSAPRGKTRRGYPFAATVGLVHQRARRTEDTLRLCVVLCPRAARMSFFALPNSASHNKN